MSTRREARECVMKGLYSYEQADAEPDHVVATLIRPPLEKDPDTREFAERLFRETLGTMEEADVLIEKHAKNWDIGRITIIDRSLLRLATTELLRFEEIPPKVSIDEAIEVAKRYSTPQSDTFVNGVLDAILIDLQKQGRLNKTGRGLIGMETIRERAESS